MTRAWVAVPCVMWLACASAPSRLSLADSAYLQALSSENQNDLDAAIEGYTRAISGYSSLQPRDSGYAQATESLTAAHLGRARLHVRKGELPKALLDSEALIRLNPGDFRGYLFRSSSRWALGDCAKALDDAAEACRMQPVPEAIEHRARVRGACGKTEDAIRDYSVLLQSQETIRPELYCARGTLYLEANRKEEAAKDFNAGCALQARECCGRLERTQAR